MVNVAKHPPRKGMQRGGTFIRVRRKKQSDRGTNSRLVAPLKVCNILISIFTKWGGVVCGARAIFI